MASTKKRPAKRATRPARRLTSFALDQRAAAVIEAEVSAGAANASAVVRAALYDYGERAAKRRTLQRLLREGMESGLDPRPIVDRKSDQAATFGS